MVEGKDKLKRENTAAKRESIFGGGNNYLAMRIKEINQSTNLRDNLDI
jgi:hypothetical protein